MTLGFLGSLHCLGMCGPIALGITGQGSRSKWFILYEAIQYNVGRVFSYAVLGVVFGIIGTSIAIAGIQQIGSVAIGVLFVLLFIGSLDIDQFLSRTPFIRIPMQHYRKWIGKLFSPVLYQRTWLLGVFNGFLPCGLVYLALAGAMLQTDLLQSVLFMVVFGMATVPALTFLIFSGNMAKGRWRGVYHTFLPYVQLALGIILILRGLNVIMPEELDFYLGLRNAEMCN